MAGLPLLTDRSFQLTCPDLVGCVGSYQYDQSCIACMTLRNDVTLHERFSGSRPGCVNSDGKIRFQEEINLSRACLVGFRFNKQQA
jgi:hypothetical protein